jgi:hypothetical protein
MSFLSKLRQRVNRDDGNLFQVGNRPLSCGEIVGMLFFVGGMLLWKLHAESGLSWIWAAASSALGLLLSIQGDVGKDGDPDV